MRVAPGHDRTLPRATMLFNSPEFLTVFLPAVCLIYFLLPRRAGIEVGIGFLFLASLFFYGWGEPRYVVMFAGAMVINWLLGGMLLEPQRSERSKTTILTLGIVANLLLLGFFKYFNFAVSIGADLGVLPAFRLDVPFPLAISFFTFQKIAFLVDCRRGAIRRDGFLTFGLFVSFFPQLIAGPIVYFREIVPQFLDPARHRVDWENIRHGAALVTIGVFKKAVLADAFALWVSPGFDHATQLSLIEAWVTSLAYTLQLYFDFSGYTDIAIGAALLFNFRLPANFNSPYRATSIQDFWLRWHITLGRFLREYVYIPLGGNRNGLVATCRNLFVTFLLGGLWHGAGWTFIAWGAAHGAAMVIHRLWHRAGLVMPTLLAWAVTLLFVHLCWVLFRAPDFAAAIKVFRGMLGMDGILLHTSLVEQIPLAHLVFEPTRVLPAIGDGTRLALVQAIVFLGIGVAIALLPRNSLTLPRRWLYVLAIAAVPFVINAVFFREIPSPFLYFRF